MPSRSARRRIDSPSEAASSRSARAASTVSLARVLSVLGPLEAIGGAQTVANRAVEADVECPDERADEGAERHETERAKHRKGQRQPVAVEEVVEDDGARMQLSLLEVRSGAVEECEIGPEAEDGDLPVAGSVLDRREENGDKEQRGERDVVEPGGSAAGLGGGGGVHKNSSRLGLTVLASVA